MAGGWSKDGAVQEQIDSTVEDALARSRQQLPDGESAEQCDECGEPIPQARRDAIRGVRFCLGCQAERDKRQGPAAGYNRRGSKDSQLR
ncbi:DksA/TraR family C4-type zinc finger protein [Halomonas urmiana]|uniref:DksA/TraR family C4-type zinc finger protein n=1 Tax=Halomonas urmiana TaxID=490901 RepID=A0A5R8ME71_9GAMM|nr:DksA/TraR family C4-type zinc finger protein [Halomonas urmiana]TLF48177.1 DksA/TraR family C4-type zinc finger protein [Halomonas urmiana]